MNYSRNKNNKMEAWQLASGSNIYRWSEFYTAKNDYLLAKLLNTTILRNPFLFHAE